MICNADGVDDDEEIDANDRTNVKKLRRGSGSGLGKIDRDDSSAHLKKKARVLVEVNFIILFFPAKKCNLSEDVGHDRLELRNRIHDLNWETEFM